MSSPTPRSDDQFTRLVSAAQQRAGGTDGWSLLGPALQRALVAEQVLSWLHHIAGSRSGDHSTRTVLWTLYRQFDDQFPGR